MSDKPEGKDGFARVWARIRKEQKIQRRAMEEHIDRIFEDPLDSHAWANLYTEAERIHEAAYFRGHLLLIMTPILVGSLAANGYFFFVS